jgi:hypothetical protein
VFNVNIPELTSAINATTKKVDQQVWLIDDSGQKIGVIVVPSQNRTATKRYAHNFRVELKLPITQ